MNLKDFVPVVGPLLGGLTDVVGAANTNYQNRVAAAAQYGQGRADTAAYNAQVRQYAVQDQADARAYDAAQLAEARNYAQGNLSRLRDAALSAGFNPLTVLGATGGQFSGGVTQGQQSAPLESPMALAPGLQMPELSAQSFVGDALRNASVGWTDQVKAQNDAEATRINAELAHAQIADLQRSHTTPRQDADFGYKSSGGEPGISLLGSHVDTNPSMPQASVDAINRRYDPFTVGGWLALGGDIWHNTFGMAASDPRLNSSLAYGGLTPYPSRSSVR